MHLFLLDKQFKPILRIPAFTSFIWTSRYSCPGSFELYFPYNKEVFKVLNSEAKYLFRQDTRKIGYIQTIKRTARSSQGTMITITGPHLEGVLQKYVFRALSNIVAGKLSLIEWFESSLLNIFPSGYAVLDQSFGSELNYTLNDPRILDSNAQSLLYTMLNHLGVSLTHEKVDDKVVFKIWRGKDRTLSSPYALLLSEKRKNIYNIEYQSSEAGCYDTVIGTGYTPLIEDYRDNGFSWIYSPQGGNPNDIERTQTSFEFELVVKETAWDEYETLYDIEIPPPYDCGGDEDTGGDTGGDIIIPLSESTEDSGSSGDTGEEEPPFEYTQLGNATYGLNHETKQQKLVAVTTYEVDREASYARFLSEAPKYITPRSESFSAELMDPSIVSLGDVVTLRDDDLEVNYDKRVEKLVESYNPSLSKVAVTFGEPIRTIKDVLNKSMGME